MAGEHIKFYDNPSALGEAAECVLTTDDDIDFAVVSGFADRVNGSMFLTFDDALTAIPELVGVRSAVIKAWFKDPRYNLTLAPETMYAGLGAFTNVVPHLDGPQRVMVGDESTLSLLGPLTLTIVHRLNPDTTISRFSAENAGRPFNPQREDWVAYRDAYIKALFGCDDKYARPLRSSHDQSLGEITLFRNNPYQTMHRVELITDPAVQSTRMAQVITAHLVERQG